MQSFQPKDAIASSPTWFRSGSCPGLRTKARSLLWICNSGFALHYCERHMSKVVARARGMKAFQALKNTRLHLSPWGSSQPILRQRLTCSSGMAQMAQSNKKIPGGCVSALDPSVVGMTYEGIASMETSIASLRSSRQHLLGLARLRSVTTSQSLLPGSSCHGGHFREEGACADTAGRARRGRPGP